MFYDEAKRVSDIEDFGEAWVLFRDAEQARRRSGDYLEAYRLYQAILKKYPGTQYSEAAEAYSIRTLLIFAGNGYEARLMNRMDSIQKRFDALLCATKSMEKDHFSSESIREQKELLAEQKAVMGLVQSLPAKGAGAFEMASKQSRDFLISEPFGLYRGEILYEMGNWFFEQQKEPTQARAYYERASNWFIEVTLKDKILDDFSWEPRITKIAAPPPSMKMQDDWGNIRWSDPEPGEFINHRTCSWYSDYYRLMSTMRVGLCAFVLGDQKSAIAAVDSIKQLDPIEGERFKNGQINAYQRLLADFTEGRLFATSMELDSFKGPHKLGIVAAEFAFEMEDWDRASMLYDELYDESKGRLSKDAAAYLEFQRINTKMRRQEERKDSLNRLRALCVSSKGTLSWSRAQFALAMFTQGEKNGAEALAAYDSVMQQGDVQSATYATYYKAELLKSQGRNKEAKTLFLLLQAHPFEPWIKIGSQRHLSQIPN